MTDMLDVQARMARLRAAKQLDRDDALKACAEDSRAMTEVADRLRRGGGAGARFAAGEVAAALSALRDVL